MQTRRGVLGGTFDPIHYGHLAIAEAVRLELGLERVVFVPAAQQPLKHRHIASAADRLAMVQLAVQSNPAFEVSELEVEREGPSYTADTLTTLHTAHPHATLWFIIGADAMRMLPQWHTLERIIAVARFAVVDRPGFTLDAAALAAIHPALADCCDLVVAPQIDLSATELRERITARRSVRYLVPDQVIEYITTRHLYAPQPRDLEATQGVGP